MHPFKIVAQQTASQHRIERTVYAPDLSAARRSVASELQQIGYRVIVITRPIVLPPKEA